MRRVRVADGIKAGILPTMVAAIASFGGTAVSGYLKDRGDFIKLEAKYDALNAKVDDMRDSQRRLEDRVLELLRDSRAAKYETGRVR